MNPFLMQLALAALGQFGGNGAMPISPMPMGGIPMGGLPSGMGLPTTGTGRSSSLQLASLATATCLMRERRLRRAQAVELLDRQGRVWGWEPRWGQRIQLTSVDRAINAAGGCRRMVRRIDQSLVAIPPTATMPVTRNPDRAGSRSESEGFGLFPYR